MEGRGKEKEGEEGKEVERGKEGGKWGRGKERKTE